jgi:hypothetical protein
MTKDEFLTRLINQITGITKGEQGGAINDIIGTRARMDKEAFSCYITDEVLKCKETPNPKSYNEIAIAKALTESICLIEKEPDWKDIWDKSAPIISNISPEKSKDWQFFSMFYGEIKAHKASVRLEIFTNPRYSTYEKEANLPI